MDTLRRQHLTPQDVADDGGGAGAGVSRRCLNHPAADQRQMEVATSTSLKVLPVVSNYNQRMRFHDQRLIIINLSVW